MFKSVNIIEIFTGSSYRGSISPTGAKIGSSYREFREIEGSRNRGFEKSGVKLWSLSEANPRETRFDSRYREVRETEGSRHRDSTVTFRNNSLVIKQNSRED